VFFSLGKTNKNVLLQTRSCSEEKEVEYFRPSFPFLSFAVCVSLFVFFVFFFFNFFATKEGVF